MVCHYGQPKINISGESVISMLHVSTQLQTLIN